MNKRLKWPSFVKFNLRRIRTPTPPKERLPGYWKPKGTPKKHKSSKSGANSGVSPRADGIGPRFRWLLLEASVDVGEALHPVGAGPEPWVLSRDRKAPELNPLSLTLTAV